MKSRTLAFLTILFITMFLLMQAIAPNAALADWTWSNTGGGVSGYWIDSLAYDSGHNLLYAGTVNHGVWKYNGTTWTDTGGGLSNYEILSLAYDSSHNLLYAGPYALSIHRGKGVWKYDGTTWTNISGKLSSYDVQSLAYDSGHNLLYAGTVNHGAWKYDGTTWTNTGGGVSNYYVLSLAYDSVHNMLYGSCSLNGTGYGVWKYDGTTWTNIGDGVSSYVIFSLAYDSVHNMLYAGGFVPRTGTGYGVWKYNGTTWTDIGGEVSSYSIWSLAYDSGRNLLYAGCSNPFKNIGNGVWQYNGATWTNMTGGISSSNIVSLFYDSVHNLLYAGTGGYGVWKYPSYSPPVPPADQWKSTFYFAEGYTGANFREYTFQEYATLENPNAAAAKTWITCMFTDGTSQSQCYHLAPVSRLTVDINQLVGAGREVSMRVVSTSPGIVAERPMYFNYNGVWTGGSDVVGATAPNANWYFAEGNTLANFDEFVTVLNPGNTAANLTFHYMVEGHGEKDATGAVGAHSRATFKTRDQIGSNKNASLYLSSDQAVVAERPMYFNYQGLASNNWTGGHDVVGANSPQKQWYLAEGTTRGGFEEWLCLENPGSSDITVNATYQFGSGQGNPVSKSYTVPAKQRLTVSVNREIGPEKDDSVALTSAGSFIAERPMYFNYQGAWSPPSSSSISGGHDVLGANSPATTWFFAEGTTWGNFNEWLCLQNPGGKDAHATITYYTSSGQAIKKSWTVSANSRLTVNVNQDAGANQDISAKVSSDKPIIVERPMYFSYDGWTGGHDVVGFVPVQ